MTFSEPPTAAAVEKYIREILRAHPCSKSFSAGKSVLGRKISVLTLGEAKGGALFAGATHGSEWLTSLVLLRFFDELCSSFERGTRFYGIDPCRALSRRGVAVLPVLNPDGVEINLRGTKAAPACAERLQRLSGGNFARWNANACGVDINHNFEAGWDSLQEMEHAAGIYGPAPRQAPVFRTGNPRGLRNLLNSECFTPLFASQPGRGNLLVLRTAYAHFKPRYCSRVCLCLRIFGGFSNGNGVARRL